MSQSVFVLELILLNRGLQRSSEGLQLTVDMWMFPHILNAAAAFWPPLQPNLVKTASAWAAPLRGVNEGTEWKENERKRTAMNQSVYPTTQVIWSAAEQTRYYGNGTLGISSFCSIPFIATFTEEIEIASVSLRYFANTLPGSHARFYLSTSQKISS
jgi:hypothetical protein